MSASDSKLFSPLQIGDLTLKHRVVMAPLTRYRASDEHVHGDLAVEYYSQRSRVPGTLLITEATFISPRAAGLANAPGIWNQEQIAAWKKVTSAVHANGSYIFTQIWALGRAASPEILQQEGPFPYVSASDVPLPDSKDTPRPLTEQEIQEYVSTFAQAAKNAVEAGFDGVEIHGANGYLVDQFIQDVSNVRTDGYGGTPEKRSRFALEVVKAVTDAIGAKRTGIRFSPWSDYQGMGMADPKPTFSYLVEQLAKQHSELAYIHLVEPFSYDNTPLPKERNNEFIRAIWQPRSLISAGGFSRESAVRHVDTNGGAVAFGRHFLANPDLPLRYRQNIPLNPYKRETFFAAKTPVGYIDYPFALAN